MRDYECECLKCHNKQQMGFTDSFPEYGDHFTAHCKHCDEDTVFTRGLTRKTKSELRRKQEEEELKKAIQNRCQEQGFTCSFYCVFRWPEIMTLLARYDDILQLAEIKSSRCIYSSLIHTVFLSLLFASDKWSRFPIISPE